MLDEHIDNERVLREHIRVILYEYAYTHLTTDYDQFTRDAVAELLSDSLELIPVHDKNAIRLPSDPWERLTELYGLQGQAPYQEKFQITAQVSQYLKSTMKSGQGHVKTDRIAAECTVGDTSTHLYERMSSFLSLKAVKSTPRMGSGDYIRDLPKNHHLSLITLPHFEEAPATQTELLNLTWRLQAEEHHAVSALLKSAAILSRPGPKYRNKYLDPTVTPVPPDICIREAATLPIFPRSGRIRGGTTQKAKILSDFQSMADLPNKIPPVVKVEDELDMATENMSVIDGWHAYSSISSPPSVASPTSSQEDNVDQLFNNPSPITSPSTLLPPRKMDVPPIPRSRRIKGGSRVKSANKESFAAFILPHANPLQTAKGRSSPDLSMIAQPTTLGIPQDEFNEDISALCASIQGGNFKAIILDEPLQSGESILMKVPMMPPPNAHGPNALFLAASLGDFVLAIGTNSDSRDVHRFLKKVKGLKSLNLTLSWTPFSAKEKLPTNIQVIGSSTLVEHDDMKHGLSKEHIEKEVQTLLQEALSMSCASDPLDRWKELDRTTNVSRDTSSTGNLDMILSRADRRRNRNRDLDAEFSDDDDGSSDKENEPVMSPYLDRPPFEDSGIGLPLDDTESLPPSSRFSKRPRLDLDVDDIASVPEPLDNLLQEDSQDIFRFSHPLDPVEPMEVEPSIYTDADVALNPQIAYPYQPIASSPVVHEAGPFHPLPFETQEGLSHTRQRFTANGSFDDPHPHVQAQSPERHPNQPPSDTCNDDLLQLEEVNFTIGETSGSSHSIGLSDFLLLRSKLLKDAETRSTRPASIPDQPIMPFSLPIAPPELFDHHTLRLPQHQPPFHEHRYIASIDLLQKNVLSRVLRSQDCAINFVEREHLAGVDLILDANTAIIFSSLVSLSSQRDALLATVSEQSWRYDRLLIIFEAYPISCSFKKADNSDATFNAYTPPAIKAMGRFRRDLSLAEACEKKRVACSVYTAFADTVRDAGLLARYFGDMAEELDATLWGDRSWLEEEVPPEEESLAEVPRMNRFAAYVILCQASVDDFLAMTPQERFDMFALLIGEERIMSVNAFIESRTQALESSDPSAMAA